MYVCERVNDNVGQPDVPTFENVYIYWIASHCHVPIMTMEINMIFRNNTCLFWLSITIWKLFPAWMIWEKWPKQTLNFIPGFPAWSNFKEMRFDKTSAPIRNFDRPTKQSINIQWADIRGHRKVTKVRKIVMHNSHTYSSFLRFYYC